MIDKWIIVGGAHFAIAAVILKFLGLILPCCITCYYSCIANCLLYIYLARFTFEITKKWHLNERVQTENRAVFVTGCDSGFGHLLAKRLDFLGYPVFAGCLDDNSSGAKGLKRISSDRLQVVKIDVTSDSSVNDAVSFVEENLGTSELWAIVNNAGILKGFEVELTDMEDFKATMEVNAFGPVRVTKAFLPLLRQSRGRVINVTSLGGRVPLPYCTPYIMSKFAAVAFSECLKHELDVWGIRVISIEPEFFKTGLSNPETIKKSIETTVSKVNPRVKEDYGEKYFKNIKSFSEVVTDFCSENVEVVVDALDEAISMEYPNTVYKPCRNILTQVIFYVSERLPLTVVHLFIKLYRNIKGFPRPREAENYL